VDEVRRFVEQQLAAAGLAPERRGRVSHLAEMASQASMARTDEKGDEVEVILRVSGRFIEVTVAGTPSPDGAPTAEGQVGPFSEWLRALLRSEGLSQEAAARRIGVSLKTVSRWVGGQTEPRLRELRRIHAEFGQGPLE
jgi:DNA-binding XRE family transcriptional regulator